MSICRHSVCVTYIAGLSSFSPSSSSLDDTSFTLGPGRNDNYLISRWALTEFFSQEFPASRSICFKLTVPYSC